MKNAASMDEAISSSVTSDLTRVTRRNIPDEGILLGLFPYSGEGKETPTLWGPLERANLNHWISMITHEQQRIPLFFLIQRHLLQIIGVTIRAGYFPSLLSMPKFAYDLQSVIAGT
jgi:hypothetical protein